MSPSSQPPRIRLVFSNGSACDFTQAMSAAEALQSSLHSLATHLSDKSFNNFFVCDSTSLRVGKRACPMHPDMQLELGRLYYVLPIRSYQRRLAWSHISALAAMAMPSSTCTPPPLMSSSAGRTHAAPSSKKSSSSKTSYQSAFSRTLVRKFYLRLILRRRSISKGKCRVVDAHTNGTSVGLPLDSSTEGRRYEGAAVLNFECREKRCRWRFNNICNSAEENSKYVELLIERSNSWRPPLLTIQESIAV